MKNHELRNYLFETIREWKWLHWEILRQCYNENVKFPDSILLKAYMKLLVDIMELEWIKRNDVVHNASD